MFVLVSLVVENTLFVDRVFGPFPDEVTAAEYGKSVLAGGDELEPNEYGQYVTMDGDPVFCVSRLERP